MRSINICKYITSARKSMDDTLIEMRGSTAMEDAEKYAYYANGLFGSLWIMADTMGAENETAREIKEMVASWKAELYQVLEEIALKFDDVQKVAECRERSDEFLSMEF